MKSKYLVKFKNIYKYKRHIPLTLQQYFGKKNITQIIKVPNDDDEQYIDAIRMAHSINVKVETYFGELNAKLTNNKTKPNTKLVLEIGNVSVGLKRSIEALVDCIPVNINGTIFRLTQEQASHGLNVIQALSNNIPVNHWQRPSKQWANDFRIIKHNPPTYPQIFQTKIHNVKNIDRGLFARAHQNRTLERRWFSSGSHEKT